MTTITGTTLTPSTSSLQWETQNIVVASDGGSTILTTSGTTGAYDKIAYAILGNSTTSRYVRVNITSMLNEGAYAYIGLTQSLSSTSDPRDQFNSAIDFGLKIDSGVFRAAVASGEDVDTLFSADESGTTIITILFDGQSGYVMLRNNTVIYAASTTVDLVNPVTGSRVTFDPAADMKFGIVSYTANVALPITYGTTDFPDLQIGHNGPIDTFSVSSYTIESPPGTATIVVSPNISTYYPTYLLKQTTAEITTPLMALSPTSVTTSLETSDTTLVFTDSKLDGRPVTLQKITTIGGVTITNEYASVQLTSAITTTTIQSINATIRVDGNADVEISLFTSLFDSITSDQFYTPGDERYSKVAFANVVNLESFGPNPIPSSSLIVTDFNIENPVFTAVLPRNTTYRMYIGNIDPNTDTFAPHGDFIYTFSVGEGGGPAINSITTDQSSYELNSLISVTINISGLAVGGEYSLLINGQAQPFTAGSKTYTETRTITAPSSAGNMTVYVQLNDTSDSPISTMTKDITITEPSSPMIVSITTDQSSYELNSSFSVTVNVRGLSLDTFYGIDLGQQRVAFTADSTSRIETFSITAPGTAENMSIIVYLRDGGDAELSTMTINIPITEPPVPAIDSVVTERTYYIRNTNVDVTVSLSGLTSGNTYYILINGASNEIQASARTYVSTFTISAIDAPGYMPISVVLQDSATTEIATTDPMGVITLDSPASTINVTSAIQFTQDPQIGDTVNVVVNTSGGVNPSKILVTSQIINQTSIAGDRNSIYVDDYNSTYSQYEVSYETLAAGSVFKIAIPNIQIADYYIYAVNTNGDSTLYTVSSQYSTFTPSLAQEPPPPSVINITSVTQIASTPTAGAYLGIRFYTSGDVKPVKIIALREAATFDEPLGITYVNTVYANYILTIEGDGPEFTAQIPNIQNGTYYLYAVNGYDGSYVYTLSTTSKIFTPTISNGGGGGGGGGGNNGDNDHNMALEFSYGGFQGTAAQTNTITVLGEEGGALTADHTIIVNVPTDKLCKVIAYQTNWTSEGEVDGSQAHPKVKFLANSSVGTELSGMFTKLNVVGTGAQDGDGRKFSDDADNKVPVFGNEFLGVTFENSALDDDELPREAIRSIAEGSIDATDILTAVVDINTESGDGADATTKALLEGLFEQAVSAGKIKTTNPAHGVEADFKKPEFIAGDSITFLVRYTFNKTRAYQLDSDVTAGNTLTGARTSITIGGNTFTIDGNDESASKDTVYAIKLVAVDSA